MDLVKVQKDGAEGFVPAGAVEHWKKKGFTVVTDSADASVVDSAVVTAPDVDGAGPDPVAPGEGDPQTSEPVQGEDGTAAGSADVTDKDQRSSDLPGRRGGR